MKHKITIVETRQGCQPMELEPRYDVLVNGQKRGQLYFNMTGYVGALPLPNGTNFGIGERGISAYRKLASEINSGRLT